MVSIPRSPLRPFNPSDTQRTSSPSPAPIGWWLEWRDFTGHQFGAVKPKCMAMGYPSREAAAAELAHMKLHRPGIVGCITPIPPPVAKARRAPLFDLPLMHKRLTR